MKNLIIAAILLSSFLSKAQNGLPPNSFHVTSDIWGNKNAQNNTIKAKATCVGLDDILSCSNITGYDIIIDDGTYQTLYAPSSFSVMPSGGSVPLIKMDYNGQLSMQDLGSGYFTRLNSGSLTLDHNIQSPNEDGTIVVHHTNTPIDVYATDYTSNHYNRGFEVKSTITGSDYMVFGILSGIPTIQVKDVISGNNTFITNNASTGNHNQNFPDDNGEYVCKHSGSNIQTLLTATSMTIPIAYGYIPTVIIPIWNTVLPSGINWAVTTKTTTTFTISFSAPISGTFGLDYEVIK